METYRDALTGQYNNVGKPTTQRHIEYLGKIYQYGGNPMRSRCHDGDNKVFDCIKSAAEYHQIKYVTAVSRVRRGTKGWGYKENIEVSYPSKSKLGI